MVEFNWLRKLIYADVGVAEDAGAVDGASSCEVAEKADVGAPDSPRYVSRASLSRR